MERRVFLLKGCALCLGSTFMAAFLESCQSIPVFKTVSKNKVIDISLDQFNKGNFLIVRPENVTYDIAVIRQNENEFKSYVMVCTHADNPLRFNGKNFTCSLHGSLFNIEGEVEKGPAERSLLSLKTQLENNSLRIILV